MACIFSLFYGSSKCLFLQKWRDKSINTIARANTHILLRRVQYVKCTYRGLIIHFAKVDFWRETTNCVFRNISVYYFLPCHGMDDFWKKVHTGCSTWNIVISNGCNDKISNKTLCKLDSFNFFKSKSKLYIELQLQLFRFYKVKVAMWQKVTEKVRFFSPWNTATTINKVTNFMMTTQNFLLFSSNHEMQCTRLQTMNSCTKLNCFEFTPQVSTRGD